MEELLPLIIGILWLLYTFYSRNQKKRAKQQPARQEAKEKRDPTFLEKLLAAEGIQIDAEEPEFYEDEELYEAPAPEPLKAKESKPFLKAELSDYIEEGQSQFSDESLEETYSMSVYDQDITSGERVDGSGFNLRDAVVYSTILDAPYINYK
jgi:hypothetical protein